MPERALRSMIIVVLMLFAGNCSKDSPNRPPPEEESLFLPHTSPENLLANLKTAYIERNVDELVGMFDGFYRFVFCPDEPGDPEPLTRSEEQQIHERMLGDDYVQTLELSFAVGAVAVDSAESAGGDSLWTAEISNVKLSFFGTTYQDPSAEPTTFEVGDGREQFWFRKTGEKDASTGEPLWTITRWEEFRTAGGWFHTRGSARPEDTTTWGSVKNMFR